MVLQKLKRTFLPSAEVSRERRINVFGRESKGFAAANIAGYAILAGAGPGFVASGGLGKAAAAIGGASLKTKFGLAVATPLVAGAISRDPTTVTKAPGQLTNFGQNLYKVGKEQTPESVVRLIKENPVIAATTGAGIVVAAGGLGGGIGNIIQGEKVKGAVQELTTEIKKSRDTVQNIPAPISPSVPAVLPQNALVAPSPITPNSPVLAQTTSSRAVSTRRKPKKIQPVQRQSVRVQIYNRNGNNYKRQVTVTR